MGEAFEAAVRALGGLDWLVLSAGMGAMFPPFGDTPSRARELAEVNFVGRQQVLKLALRHLARTRGKAVVLSSNCVREKSPGLGLYKGSHAAMEAYSTEMGMEFAKLHVAVNVVAPSWVESSNAFAAPMTDELKPELAEKIRRRMPLGRMLWPEEVADVACGLLSMTHRLTGAIIPVTGGFA